MTRFFDVFFSLLAIVVLLPFMLPIMLLLKLTGEHDIFYRQMRVGKGEKEFGILKFATMLRNSPNMPGGLFTLKDDPRMLPMGKFLRKTKINELPQLVNIFKGDMSVIGYRPQLKKQYMKFPEKYRKVMKGDRPGLSGIGSIVFRNEEEILQSIPAEDKETFYTDIISPYKGALECWYIQHKNLGRYFQMILLTVEAVLFPSKKSWKKLKGLPETPEELKKWI